MPFPKTLGACADKLYKLRQKRLEQQKKVQEIEKEEKALKAHIIETLPKSKASGISGKVARVSVITKKIPQVKDWETFYKHVKRTGNFELLQRRVSDAAVKERWEDGKKVPGVDHFNAVTISINKL